MIKRMIIFILLLKGFCAIGIGQVIYIDQEAATPAIDSIEYDQRFTNLKEGINAAASGDLVLVAPGTYTGENNTNLSFAGKNFTLRGIRGPKTTIIDCQQNPDRIAFTFDNNETKEAVLDGLTMQNCNKIFLNITTMYFGGGGRIMKIGGSTINIDNSSPSLKNLFFKNNSYNKLSSGNKGIIRFNSSHSIIENCFFIGNQAHEEGALNVNSSNLIIKKSIFFNNQSSYSGGAIYLSSSTLKIDHSTFVNNNVNSNIYSYSSNIEIYNSILESTSPDSDVYIKNNTNFLIKSSILHNIEINNSDNSNTISQENIISQAPHFIKANPEWPEDFQLAPGSPGIDQGMVIDDLYTDMQGSLMFLDGDNDNAYVPDMGAFEYNPASQGTAVRPFSNLELEDSSVYYEQYNYDISWEITKIKDQFFHKLNQRFAAGYTLNLYAVHGNEKLLLKTLSIDDLNSCDSLSNNNLCQQIRTRFPANSHNKKWKLRLEVVGVPDLYVESSTTYFIHPPLPSITGQIGAYFTKPTNVKTGTPPTYASKDKDKLFWDPVTEELYPIEPFDNLQVTWELNSDNTSDNTFTQTVVAEEPVLKHYWILGSPPEVLLRADSVYDQVEIHVYDQTDAKLSANFEFYATLPGKATLIYTSSQKNVLPKVQVVVVLSWEDALADGLGYDQQLTEIGQPLKVAEYQQSAVCKQAYVVKRLAAYDASIYNRDERTGAIIPVNTHDGREETDFQVITYQQDAATLSCWPSVPVRFLPQWPQEPVTINITNGYGSFQLDILNQEQNKFWQLYEQSDINQPGYNPNQEHAIVYKAKSGLVYFLNSTQFEKIRLLDGEQQLPEKMLTLLSQWVSANTKARPLEKEEDAKNLVISILLGDIEDGQALEAQISAKYEGLTEEAFDGHISTILEQIKTDNIGLAVFGLREDLKDYFDRAENYVLFKYRNAIGAEWHYQVYHVERGNLTYQAYVGEQLRPPYPLNEAGDIICQKSAAQDNASWQDYQKRFWAKYAHDPSDDLLNTQIQFYEKWQGECLPWLDAKTGTPATITYQLSWPESIPMKINQTFRHAQDGLEIANECRIDLLYDQATDQSPDQQLVKLVNYYQTVEQNLSAALQTVLKNNLSTETEVDGKLLFSALPLHLQLRLYFIPATNEAQDNAILGWRAYHYKSTDLYLPNFISALDQQIILEIFSNYLEPSDLNNLETVLQALQTKAQAVWNARPQFLDQENSHHKILTAGSAAGTGYVTLAMNNKANCPGNVKIEVIKVIPFLDTGNIQTMPNNNAFTEYIYTQTNNDFGGNLNTGNFQYCYQDVGGEIPDIETLNQNYDPNTNVCPGGWLARSEIDFGLRIGGSGREALIDKYFIMRYKGYAAVGDVHAWSQWSPVFLYMGWIKRAANAINPYEQRLENFRDNENSVSMISSMVAQAGAIYEGPVALNQQKENIDNLGLIEIYQTMLRTARKISIDAANPVSDPGINRQLLLVSSRIANLYQLLANEAYADATDPTIGMVTMNGTTIQDHTSLFSFQNQLSNLLEEELGLLRGRDENGSKPYYNRLIWNFTNAEGEAAYVTNYNITDQNDDEKIDEYDAQKIFPQGHGDAWGHYLTALKIYYQLLRHPNFEWIPEAEVINILDHPVEVDYHDERIFAQIAAAKAKTGGEIVNLTYRQYFLENPDTDWTGYYDTEVDRAWGVNEWAQRAGQGAYFDWVVANAMLPDEDNEHTGLSKIDRTTVTELDDIAGSAVQIQIQLDQAEQNLNPLGLAKNSLPFDIDPTEIQDGKTHFEQIYDRAVNAINTAIAAFNLANSKTQSINQQTYTLEEFRKDILEQEKNYTNSLIDIFGTPYPDDNDFTYGTHSEVPDLKHYDYIDLNQLIQEAVPNIYEIKAEIPIMNITDTGVLEKTGTQEVTYHLSSEMGWPTKPEHWEAPRNRLGQVQTTLHEFYQNILNFQTKYQEYLDLIQKIKEDAALMRDQYQMNINELDIKNELNQITMNINDEITNINKRQIDLRNKAENINYLFSAMAEGLPGIMGFIAGLSAGTIFDPTSQARGTFMKTGALMAMVLNQQASQLQLDIMRQQNEKEELQLDANYQLLVQSQNHGLLQQKTNLEQLIRSELTQRMALYALEDSIRQTYSRYTTIKAKGLALRDERERFRQRTANLIQRYRYQDMTFRLLRNNALAKFRTQFDTAARYVYLAARAYDFETGNLYHNQDFLTDIVRQRHLGVISDGTPLTGTGLANVMAVLGQNFSVEKGQMGFNNPQILENWFSLRTELLRIPADTAHQKDWQNFLANSMVDDLWTELPEFSRLALPLDPGNQKEEPALVIRFSSTITNGLNFFGNKLNGGDSSLPTTTFATKIRAVGIWLPHYDTALLAKTPYAYLIPAGADVIRIKDYEDYTVRSWNIIDQRLPSPFAFDELSSSSLNADQVLTRRHPLLPVFTGIQNSDGSSLLENTRLIGRSIWNTEWILIIPASPLLADAQAALKLLIYGNCTVEENCQGGIDDVRLYFKTYGYSGG